MTGNDDFVEYFKRFDSFSTADIAEYFKRKEPELNQSTLNWRVFEMAKKGTIVRMSKGLFRINDGNVFKPIPDMNLLQVAKKVQNHFPEVGVCVWDTAILNSVSQHIVNHGMYIIEVEKDAAEPVFVFLREKLANVYLNPTHEIVDNYLSPSIRKPYVIKNLLSESPWVEVKGVRMATMEKILVDIYCDKTLHFAYQGHEMRRIFENCFELMPINTTKLLRYASRRGKTEEMAEMIKPFIHKKRQYD